MECFVLNSSDGIYCGKVKLSAIGVVSTNVLYSGMAQIDSFRLSFSSVENIKETVQMRPIHCRVMSIC